MNNLKRWAKREIELATNDPEINEEVDKCYQTAYQAFCDFVDRINDVKTPEIVKAIFFQLFNECNLVPIEDKQEEWDPTPCANIYQSNRRPSLYKKLIFEDDRKEPAVRYSDQKRAVCIDLNTNKYYEGGVGMAVLDEMCPIKMPYQPVGIIKIITEDFQCYEDENKESDTFAVLYFKMPDGNMIKVMRFFKVDKKTNETVEIDKTEYFYRKKKSKKI